MPLIIMCGKPCSGKSYISNKIYEYFKDNKNVILITDEEKLKENQRNILYSDSAKEKQLRGWLKSETERHLTSEKLVILDSSNYIKGYRYELYCLSKERKSTVCVVESVMPDDLTWGVCQVRHLSQRYDRTVYDGLIQRYEEPDSRNRWDSPLFVINYGDNIPFDTIEQSLYSKQPPKPNLSTQTTPLTPTSFLYQLDNKTQLIVKTILSSIQLGKFNNIKIAGSQELIHLNKPMSQGELSRIRRQFINYIKMHPQTDINKIETMFVQYVNTSNN